MRRPWTERRSGWSADDYVIEEVTSDLWVLSRETGAGPSILATAQSPTKLEAFSTIHSRVRGGLRPLLLVLIYVASLMAVVGGSLIGSAIVIIGASVVTASVVAKFAEYTAGRRMVRLRSR